MTGSLDPAASGATSPLEPHNTRAAAVWSAGGAAYDEISRAIADAIEHCVRRFAPRPGERVLDVATGTGWTSRRVADAGARVTGVDIAEGLLDAARAKARQAGLEIDYRLGDAERLPFADAAFDGVISTFGVMFVSRPEAAAAELARTCRPGGRLALATWLPDSTVAEMFALLRPFMPPPAPGIQPPLSPFAWGDKARLAELLGAGFDLRFEQGISHHRMPSGQAMWELFSTGYGPTKSLAASLDAGRRAELQEAFVAFHDRHRTELGITTPRGYLITVGTRR